jgi:hypothetical protein
MVKKVLQVVPMLLKREKVSMSEREDGVSERTGMLPFVHFPLLKLYHIR